MNSVQNFKKISYLLFWQFQQRWTSEQVWAIRRRSRPSTFTNKTSIHFSVRTSAPVQNLRKRVRISESISLMNRFRWWNVDVASSHIYSGNLGRHITRLGVSIKAFYSDCIFANGKCILFKTGLQQSIKNIAACTNSLWVISLNMRSMFACLVTRLSSCWVKISLRSDWSTELTFFIAAWSVSALVLGIYCINASNKSSLLDPNIQYCIKTG